MSFSFAGFAKAFGKDPRPLDQQVEGAITDLENKVNALKGGKGRNKRDTAAAAYEGYVTEFRAALAVARNEKDPKKEKAALNKLKKEAERRARNAEQAASTYPTDAIISDQQEVLKAIGESDYDTSIRMRGKEAKTDEDKQTLIAALKVRFGIDKISGDLNAKALPRLYNLMTKIPLDHVKGNTSLKEIRRDKESGEASFYQSRDQRIVLNVNDPGSFLSEETYTADDGTKRKASTFDLTTLHEIGHAVDHRTKYMENNGGQAACGGWMPTTIEAVAAACGKDKGFFDAFKAHPPGVLAGYLQQVLKTGKAEPQPNVWTQKQTDNASIDFTKAPDLLKDDPGLKLAEQYRTTDKSLWPDPQWSVAQAINDAKMKRAVPSVRPPGKPVPNVYGELLNDAFSRILNDNKAIDTAVDEAVDALKAAIPGKLPDRTEWDAMAKHDAVRWCKSVRQSGDCAGLWEGGKSAADKAKLSDGYIYQQAYETEWWKYKGRKESVSSYQFRAPGEWFAELYAAYYMGWLDKKHWIGSIAMPPS